MEIMNWDAFLFPYEQAVRELCEKFRGLEKEFVVKGQHSPIELVEGRVKQIGSILEKAHRRNIPLEKIETGMEDIAGVRIICRFVEDIEKVRGLIHARDGIDLRIMGEQDYITHTKPSGYRSFHMACKYAVITTEGVRDIVTEIQIRTMAMNFWATIEHSLKYKYNGNIPEDLQKRLISSAEAAYRLDREMGTIRGEILEAQKIIKRKNDLVDEILRNIQNLHYIAHLDKMGELNRAFLELYQEGDVEKLHDFNQQLIVMAELYKVRYV